MGLYYDVRCKLCNKFITKEDMSDDGLCSECAERLDWLSWEKAAERLFRWRMATYALAILNLVLNLVLVLIFWR